MRLYALAPEVGTHFHSDTVEEASSVEAIQAAATAGPPTAVLFYAPWCPHCQDIMPLYDRVARGVTDVKFLTIDASSIADVRGHLMVGISAYPTVKFFAGGEGAMANHATYDWHGAIEDDLRAFMVAQRQAVVAHSPFLTMEAPAAAPTDASFVAAAPAATEPPSAVTAATTDMPYAAAAPVAGAWPPVLSEPPAATIPAVSVPAAPVAATDPFTAMMPAATDPAAAAVPALADLPAMAATLLPAFQAALAGRAAALQSLPALSLPVAAAQGLGPSLVSPALSVAAGAAQASANALYSAALATNRSDVASAFPGMAATALFSPAEGGGGSEGALMAFNYIFLFAMMIIILYWCCLRSC